MPLPLPFFLSFPLGICFFFCLCPCPSFCHSPWESACARTATLALYLHQARTATQTGPTARHIPAQAEGPGNRANGPTYTSLGRRPRKNAASKTPSALPKAGAKAKPQRLNYCRCSSWLSGSPHQTPKIRTFRVVAKTYRPEKANRNTYMQRKIRAFLQVEDRCSNLRLPRQKKLLSSRSYHQDFREADCAGLTPSILGQCLEPASKITLPVRMV